MKTIKSKLFVSGLGAVLMGLVFLTLGTSAVRADVPAAGDVARGVKAWADNCGRCHNVRGPMEFRDDQWKVIVSHMRVRAGLTGQDARDILKFLQESN